ncbi:unnamed protein product [Rotaria magnacalcarata]|nr:unnamed protein product [Rotaria magnacalcarata]
MIDLADKVMESYALTLQLPADWFKPITRKPIAVARLAYYPSFSCELSQDQLSCGAHTDDNGVTLLMQQEGVCGLQVKNGQGEWIDAVPIHGTIVVNIGDLVERWSNGHFKATEHRVLMQPGVERYSAIVFHTPDYHATIECCVKDEIPKYPAIIAGDFIKNRGEAHSKPLDQWTDNEQNLISAEEYSLKLRADVNQKH